MRSTSPPSPPGDGFSRRLGAVFFLGFVAAAAADLTLEIEVRWRGNALEVPSRELTTAIGQRVQITRFTALLSEVALHRLDGGEVRLDGQYGLFDAGGGRRGPRWSGVPPGDYDGVSFSVGLPPAVNHSDPGLWPAGHPLHPLLNALHWNWQGGYVFSALEGRWRAPQNGVGRGFLYHIAKQENLRRVTFRSRFTVMGDHEVRLAWDIAGVWSSRELREDDGSDSTHSGAGDASAGRIADALARGWFWLAEGSAPRAPLPPAGEAAVAAVGTPFAFVVPAGFPQPSLPADNPLTLEGIELGRRLFADLRLSRTGTQACASCHRTSHALGDDVALSRGVRGEAGARNAMPLFNLAWSPAFAWDGRQPRLRDQARSAWTSPLEMDTNPEAVTPRVEADPGLASMARRAFGDGGITVDRVLLALEQYLLSEVSSNSRFDRALRGEMLLTAQEQRGFELFNTEHDPVRGQYGADCFHCHGGALFTDFGFKHNGLVPAGSDRGRAGVTGDVRDEGSFKTPSLRNVALTGPYLHDGSVPTLEGVVARYDHGVVRSGNLDPNLAKHPAAGLALTPDDQAALVVFLRALTDPRFESLR